MCTATRQSKDKPSGKIRYVHFNPELPQPKEDFQKEYALSIGKARALSDIEYAEGAFICGAFIAGVGVQLFHHFEEA